MVNSPEAPVSPASRVSLLPWLLLILAVGAGMYFLGRRSHGTASGTNHPGQDKPLAAAPGTGVPAQGAPGENGGRHFAPHDTFYLLQYVSAKTATGVMGFEPGQEVHLVEVHQPTQTLVVSDGEAQVEVGPDKLTNDMDVAAMVRQKDESNQAKITAYVQSEQKAYEDSKRDAAVKTEQALDKIDQKKEQVEQQQTAAMAANNAKNADKPSGSPSVGSGDTKLDEPPVEVGGSSGYGYAGSSYYGSPYSYFTGASGVTTVPATGTGTRTGTSVGSRGGTGGRR